MEESVLAFWEQHDVFKASISQRADAPEFVFYDGPPFATGLPHFGHFVPGTIKDVIPRYQTMNGKRVERRFGWDCHGLPVEYEVEKSLKISGKSQIEAFGVGKFNEECRSIVLRYTAEWKKTITRLGRWVDFDNDYKTMEPSYMETIWWVFKRLWEKGLIYEGFYILPYSPALATPLSNFEVNLGGYKDVHDPAITVRFKLSGDDKIAKARNLSNKVPKGATAYFLAWTTTPWTLPSNLGLTLGPDIDYVLVQDNEKPGDCYVLAEARLESLWKEPALYTVLGKWKGSDLAGITYEPLFPYFAEHAAKGAFRTHVDDFVTTGDGTGIVHTAPGFGEDDYRVMKNSGVPVVCPIDAECRFTDEVPDFVGQFVKDADKAIIQRLRDEGKLVKRDTILHSYPHCYRSGSPLIYRAVSSWFVDIDKVKSSMLAANDKMHWIPGHLQRGRFGKWLENARDWAISRNRFWGNPIPVWKCDGSDYVECIGSIAELQQKSGQKVSDLHKHFVDEITWPSPDGKGTMRRVSEVLDCWFESGAMPYAQNHYPFENKERVEAYVPAHFICEGLDQTRGWFYTLTVLAAALFDRPAFANVVCSGLVLAEDGKKMSKSARNFTDPNKVIDSFGADAMRLYLMNSAVTRSEDLKYSDEGVRDVLKSTIIPLWNAYSFFVTYANLDGFQANGIEHGRSGNYPVNPLDCWILSLTETLVKDVRSALDAYEMEDACRPIMSFIDQLNNWYIRRSRRRFWKSENDGDKLQAYETLNAVLLRLVLVAAPIMPFITEEIYQNLKADGMKPSVHLADYPVVMDDRIDLNLERRMSVTQKAVSMGRALRAVHNLKNRQPLKTMYLVTKDEDEQNILHEMEDIIREELNVKEVVLRENEEELVTYSAKANFKVLGPKLGKNMKAAADVVATFRSAEIVSLLEGGSLHIDANGQDVEINMEAIMVQRTEKQGLKVLNDGSLTIGLDPEVSEELKQEGIVRDVVRSVQNLRKESGYDVSDRIQLCFHAESEIVEAITAFHDYLCDETLCMDLSFSGQAQEHELEGWDGVLSVGISKV